MLVSGKLKPKEHLRFLKVRFYFLITDKFVDLCLPCLEINVNSRRYFFHYFLQNSSILKVTWWRKTVYCSCKQLSKIRLSIWFPFKGRFIAILWKKKKFQTYVCAIKYCYLEPNLITKAKGVLLFWYWLL